MSTLNKLSVATAVALTLTFSGCGGGGSSSSTETVSSSSETTVETPVETTVETPVETPTTITRQFVDSPVQGMSYECQPSGRSGKTNVDGNFTCEADDEKTFFLIAGRALGYIKNDNSNITGDGEKDVFGNPDGVVRVATPFQLYQMNTYTGYKYDNSMIFQEENQINAGTYAVDMDRDYASLIAMLLQTLDNDGNASNGIVITEEAESKIKQNSIWGYLTVSELKKLLKKEFAETYVPEDIAVKNMITYLNDNDEEGIVPLSSNVVKNGFYQFADNKFSSYNIEKNGVRCVNYDENGNETGNVNTEIRADLPYIIQISGTSVKDYMLYSDDYIFNGTVKHEAGKEEGNYESLTDLKGSFYREKVGSASTGHVDWKVVNKTPSRITYKMQNEKMILTLNTTVIMELVDNPEFTWDHSKSVCDFQIVGVYDYIEDNEVANLFENYEKLSAEYIYSHTEQEHINANPNN
jgi:hypothetical protein